VQIEIPIIDLIQYILLAIATLSGTVLCCARNKNLLFWQKRVLFLSGIITVLLSSGVEISQQTYEWMHVSQDSLNTNMSEKWQKAFQYMQTIDNSDVKIAFLQDMSVELKEEEITEQGVQIILNDFDKGFFGEEFGFGREVNRFLAKRSRQILAPLLEEKMEKKSQKYKTLQEVIQETNIKDD
jgi:hypothetical protein